eukprot:gb/GEZN01007202.1/.p1 GENE.gb/GEZN01007202.1/~~gb/GEZN01007202.1/.p1  ORF type:complete len:424 (-),score=96.37 gb/GEZN01007202.1/:177-1448(-)
MSEAIVARLEAVVNKLDKSGGGDDGGPPPSLAAYNDVYTNNVQPFLEVCGKFPELKAVGDRAKSAFEFVKTVLEAASVCDKPSDEDFIKFLAPIVKAITDSSNPDNRSKFFNHEKAFSEIIQSLSWLMNPGPGAFVREQLNAADMYLNKILMAAKDMADPEKTNHRDYVKTIKGMMGAMADLCDEWYKTGMVWKFKGTALSAFKPGAKPAAASEGKKSPDERLEALALRLERLAAKSGGGDDDNPAALGAYDEYYTANVAPFLAVCATFPELKDVGAGYEKAYKHQRTVIAASFKCKSPSQEDFMKFLKPIVEVIEASGKIDNRSAFFNHQKAFNESIQGLSWIMMPGGGSAYVEGQLEASMLYLNKVLMAAKDMPDPAKTNHRDFVKHLKGLMTGLAEYSKEYFKMGMGWNPKGGSVLEFKA